MTRLDHNRALSQLAKKTGAPVDDIKHLTIWGNHSATQYPDWYAGHDRRQAGRARSSATAAGSRTPSSRPSPSAAPRSSRPAARPRPRRAANAAIDHVYDWVNGTPEGDWTSRRDHERRLVRRARGPDQLASRSPASGGEWEIVQGLEIDDFSRGKIDASVAELVEERDAVRELGLI